MARSLHLSRRHGLNNALLTNEVDVITRAEPGIVAQFADNPAYTVTEGASTTRRCSHTRPRRAFDNVKVRKALARANRQAAALNSIGRHGTLIGSSCRDGPLDTTSPASML